MGATNRWTLFGLGTGLSLCACSASDSKSPPEVCEDYVSAYCAKAVECAQETDRADFAELCDFSLRVYLPCQQVTRVWKDAQPCQDQIAGIGCASVTPGSFPPNPDACKGLFGIE
jgi:hypothetical protein